MTAPRIGPSRRLPLLLPRSCVRALRAAPFRRLLRPWRSSASRCCALSASSAAFLAMDPDARGLAARPGGGRRTRRKPRSGRGPVSEALTTSHSNLSRGPASTMTACRTCAPFLERLHNSRSSRTSRPALLLGLRARWPSSSALRRERRLRGRSVWGRPLNPHGEPARFVQECSRLLGSWSREVHRLVPASSRARCRWPVGSPAHRGQSPSPRSFGGPAAEGRTEPCEGRPRRVGNEDLLGAVCCWIFS